MIPDPALSLLLERTAFKPDDAELVACADVLRARHGDVLAVLCYGSALRTGDRTDTLIDFYVLTRDFQGVSTNGLSRFGCRLVPPNVYYTEAEIAGRTLRMKYAVLPLGVFAARMGRAITNSYFWARFAQPCRVVWAADKETCTRVVAALAQACATVWANALSLPASLESPENDLLARWAAVFSETYRTELRSEGPGRAADIVAMNAAYYRDVAAAIGVVSPVRGHWGLRRIQGKSLSVLRLMKAAFTFQGGADYAAWKIARHSGVKIEVTDWQRRHPLLAGLMLAPRLLWRKGLR